jgi:uncharacterized membrane protein YqgA involved in biofilm formation
MKVIYFIKTHITECFAAFNISLGLLMNDWMLIFQMVLVAVGVIGGVISAWVKLDNWLYEKRKRRHEGNNN